MNLKENKKSLFVGRIVIAIIAVIIALLCIYNPPQIFWITYLGATIVACSWLPIAIASIWSKRVTKAGAFAGMLVGFLVSSVYKIITAVKHLSLPIYLDPFFVGIGSSIIALILVSLCTKVTEEEKRQRELLFIMPETEKDPKEIKKTKICIALSIPMGLLVTLSLLALWVIPYLKGLK